MEAKYYFLNFVIFIGFINGFSQGEQQTKGDWIFSAHVGFASLEAENSFKVNATAVETFIGKELNCNKKASIIFGLEHSRLNSDFNNDSNEQLYLVNNYLTLPIIYQVILRKDQTISFLMGIGPYGSYLYKSEIEYVFENTSTIQNGLGMNFGLQINAGTKLKLDETINIILGLKAKTDFAKSYKSTVQKFNLKDFYGFTFGLALDL